MKIIALISQKGGVGKTTLAVNLAGRNAAHGRRTLLLDMDTQGSSLVWADLRGDDKPPDCDEAHPLTLGRKLDQARREGYGLCVIDTDPRSKEPALAAARAADRVMIPVKPNTFDLAALATTLDLCSVAQKVGVVVFSDAPTHRGRALILSDATKLVEAMNAQICPVTIHHRTAYADALVDGRTVAEYSPTGEAAAEIDRLLEWVLHDDMAAKHHAAMALLKRRKAG